MYIPREFSEVIPGVYQRTIPADPVAGPVSQSYADRALEILLADAAHYRRLMPGIIPILQNLPRCIDIMSWGGGHPKLEALTLRAIPEAFQFDCITVVDAAAKMYRDHHRDFEAIYGKTDVLYLEIHRIGPLLVSETQKHPPELPFLNTFVHFLEHSQSWQEVDNYLRACAPAPMLIYGPNIAAAAAADWCHFRPADHNVFWHPQTMHDHLRTLYPHVLTHTHADDLFHLAW